MSDGYFNLNNISQLLGELYIIYRLHKDGFLNDQTEEAWNCVYVPKNCGFETFSDKLRQTCAD